MSAPQSEGVLTHARRIRGAPVSGEVGLVLPGESGELTFTTVGEIQEGAASVDASAGGLRDGRVIFAKVRDRAGR